LVAQSVAAYRGPKDLSVSVTNHPKRTRGCAQLGRPAVVLALGPKAKPSKAALILRHELAHVRGLEHEDMGEELLFSEGQAPGWARKMTLRRRG
jgi:hypothetical protein